MPSRSRVAPVLQPAVQPLPRLVVAGQLLAGELRQELQTDGVAADGDAFGVVLPEVADAGGKRVAGGRTHAGVAGSASIAALPPGGGDDVMGQVVLVAQAPGVVAGDLEALVSQLHGGGRERDLQHAGADAEERALLGHAGLEHGIGARIRAQHHQPVIDLHERLLRVDVDTQLAAQASVPGRVPMERVAAHRGAQWAGVLDGRRARGGLEQRAVGQLHA